MNMMFMDKFRDMGLLCLRLGLGAMFMYHGFPALVRGPEYWVELGGAMGHLGMTFMPTFWGFLAAVALFFGGMSLFVGLYSRIACVVLACTMFVAVLTKLSDGGGIGAAAHALEVGIVFASMFLIGPGKLSVDARMSDRHPAHG